jgi:hypothetical protein
VEILIYENNIEDEDHFFLHCRINNQPRNLLFNIIGNYCSNFVNMSDLNKLKYKFLKLLSCNK